MADKWPGAVVSEWPGTVVSKMLTAGGEVKRGLGLGTRNVIEGTTQLLGIVGDPLNTVTNAATGSNLGSVSGGGAQLADAMGLPREQGSLEQATGAMVRGGVGALIPVVGATGAVARGGGTVAQALASQPVLQTVAGGTAGLGGELARQSGGGVLSRLAASLVAGIAPFGVAPIASAIPNPLARFGPQFVERGAGQILREGASNPDAARAAILARPDATPGTMPTTAEVAQDAGLAGLQRASANLTTNAAGGLGDRTAANALARQEAIDATLGEGDTAAVSGYAARQAAALEAATGRNIAKVGALEPYDVSGDAARGQLEEARKVSNARVAHAYEHPDIVDAQSQPVRLAPPDMVDNLPQPVANPERAAFEQAARAGLKAGDTSNKATGGLASWIISRGGIRPTRWNGELGIRENATGVGDLKSYGINSKARVGLFNNSGADVDTMARMAQDEGFFPAGQDVTADDLVQLLDTELRSGKPVYRRDDMRAVDRAQANEEADYWGRMFQNADTSPEKMTPDDWDSLYRDVQELPPHTMTEADAVAMGGEGVGRPVGAMQSALLGLRHDFYAAGEVPPVIDDAIKAVVSTEVATVRDVSAMSRRFRDLADRTDSGTDRAFLRSAADAVDGFLRVNAGPEYADALKAAQRAAREHHDIFSRGNVGAALAKTMRGGGRTDTLEAGKVPSRLVPASDKTGAPDARQLKTALGDTGAETVAREELRRELDKAGNDAGRIAAVEAKYKGVLGEFPALSADIAAAGETAAAHAAFLKSPLGSLRDGNVDVASKVATALGRGGNAELHGMIAATRGDAAAQAGLRRAIAQYVVPGGPSAVVTAGGKDVPRNLEMYKRITNALDRTKDTGLLTGQQRAALGRLKNELASQQFASSAARASGSDTAMNAGVAGKFMKAAAKAAERATTGSNMISGIIEAIGAVTTRSGAIHEMVNRAMLDPDFAAKLLAKPTTAGKADLVKSLLPPVQSSIAGGGVVGVPANIGTGMASAAASTDQTAKDK